MREVKEASDTSGVKDEQEKEEKEDSKEAKSLETVDPEELGMEMPGFGSFFKGGKFRTSKMSLSRAFNSFHSH